MKKIAIATLIGSALLFTGCASQVAQMKPSYSTQPTVEKRQTFFIGGIGQEQTIDAAQACGGASNVTKVESKLEPLDIVLGAVTFGIYTPHTAKVYCK